MNRATLTALNPSLRLYPRTASGQYSNRALLALHPARLNPRGSWFSGGDGVQTERPIYEEIEELLGEVEPPRVALVEQSVDGPPALTDIRAAVGEALRSVELPAGTVAIGVGSRGVGKIAEVVAGLVGVLKVSGAEPFIVPAMGSHGASTGEGQARVLAHLGVSEESMGCPVRATMEAEKIGETPAGVAVYMDRKAFEADAGVGVNRIKPHTAFRGEVGKIGRAQV